MSLTVGRPLVGPPHGHGHAHAGGDGHSHGHEAGHAGHGHGHHHAGHGHAGVTTSAEERPSQPSRGIAIDVGEGMGALVLYADAERQWMEPEIHPVGRAEERQHVWVLERLVGSGSLYAAVFPSLPEGRYAICSPGGESAQEVEITGGTVTEARWL